MRSARRDAADQNRRGGGGPVVAGDARSRSRGAWMFRRGGNRGAESGGKSSGGSRERWRFEPELEPGLEAMLAEGSDW